MARPSATRTPQSSSTRRLSRRVAALVASEPGEVSTPDASKSANGQSDDSAGGGEEDGVNGVPDTPRTGYVTAEEDFSDSSGHGNAESDDDDEAPEDVSFQGGRQAAVVQAQETGS
ncbi:hypothetical protein V1517DRAFT_336169 [Lipomyces orientalis]|uniref:Uncharacterized protein n=1 Tax=Lipomyces orientalis TaxID=1233043 RepID=A0ACC3TV43_9ASCO